MGPIHNPVSEVTICSIFVTRVNLVVFLRLRVHNVHHLYVASFKSEIPLDSCKIIQAKYLRCLSVLLH